MKDDFSFDSVPQSY